MKAKRTAGSLPEEPVPHDQPLHVRLGLRLEDRTRSVTLRVAIGDLERARAVAERKGIPYQTLLKMLIHEGLAREER